MAFRFTVAVLAFMVSGVAFSAVTVTAPEEIKVIAVNGQEVSNGFLRKNNQYKIDAGENTIHVRYTEFFQHADNSHDILKSGVVAVKTPALIDGAIYHLALIQAPQDFDEAQKYKDQPIIGLYDQKNTLLVQQAGAKTNQKNWLGENLFSDSATDLTKNKVVVPVNQPAPIYTSAINTNKSVSFSTNSNTAFSDQQLIQLWQKSSKQDRQKFMSWLAEQTN